VRHIKKISVAKNRIITTGDHCVAQFWISVTNDVPPPDGALTTCGTSENPCAPAGGLASSASLSRASGAVNTPRTAFSAAACAFRSNSAIRGIVAAVWRVGRPFTRLRLPVAPAGAALRRVERHAARGGRALRSRAALPGAVTQPPRAGSPRSPGARSLVFGRASACWQDYFRWLLSVTPRHVATVEMFSGLRADARAGGRCGRRLRAIAYRPEDD